jgi:hypothetical protein
MGGSGRLPAYFVNLTDEQMTEYGTALNKEEDVLASLGLSPSQVERAKKNFRWRRCWDKGYAIGLVKKGTDMSSSTDSAILKLYADKVIPRQEEVDITIEYKAPKWFYQELEVSKIKKARKDV